jgi:hypothetical protein
MPTTSPNGKKMCKQCETIFDLDNFYRGGNNQSSYQSRCKSCFNAFTTTQSKIRNANKPKKQRPNGFMTLEESQKAQILSMYGAKKTEGYTIKSIAQATNVPYATLKYWIKNGIVK